MAFTAKILSWVGGGGGGGGTAPPPPPKKNKIGGNSAFLGSKRNLSKANL